MRTWVAVFIVFAAAAAFAAGGRASDQRGQGPGRAGQPTASRDPLVAPSEAGTSAISGIAVDAESGQPIAGVVVYLGPPQHGPQGQPLRQVTDAKGRFVFPRLPAYDGYFISASKPGYLDGTYGRASSGQGGARISVTDGQWVPDIRVVMSRPGSISGTVIDDHGEPIVGAVVRVLQQIAVAGEMQLAAGQVATSDDRGGYRVAYLMPGTYYVQLPSMQHAGPVTTAATAPAHPIAPRSDDGTPRVYPITFFPAAPTIAGATTVTIAAGEARGGIDLQVIPVPGRTVTGRVEGPPAAAAGLTLRLMLPGTEDLADGAAAATAVVGSDGRFTFIDVPAGAYVIDGRDSISEYQSSVRGGSAALPQLPGTPSAGQGTIDVTSSTGAVLFFRAPTSKTGLWVRQPTTVDAQVATDVIVTPRKGGGISGRLVFEGAARPVEDALTAWPAHGTASLGVRGWRAIAGEPGTFVIDGLMPGEYVLSSGFFLKSTVCVGQDYTFRAFDMSAGRDVTDCIVTLTSESSTVSGSARDDRGQGMPEIGIIGFPVEPQQWTALGLRPARIKSVQATNAGFFRLQGLPAGDYFLIAVPAEQVNAWQEPGFLAAAAPEATRVLLGWGDVKTQDLKLKVIRWPR